MRTSEPPPPEPEEPEAIPLRAEASEPLPAIEEPPPPSEPAPSYDHEPSIIISDAPVTIDSAPESTSLSPSDAETDAFLASVGTSGGAARTSRRWVLTAAGALFVGGLVLVGLRWESPATADASVEGAVEANRPAAVSSPAQSEPAAAPEPTKPAAEPEPTEPAPEPAAAEAPEPAPEPAAEPKATHSVRLRVRPADAAIYAGGHRIGAGEMQIDLEPGERKVVLAQLEGYAPRRIVLDGSTAEKSVHLQPKGVRAKPREENPYE